MYEDFYTVLTWSIVIAVIAAICACVGVVIKYKSKLKAPIYPIDKYARLSISSRRDDFINRNVTRVRVSSSRKD